MKSLNKVFAFTILLIAAVFVAVNIFTSFITSDNRNREYLVEVNRLCAAIERDETPDIESCKAVTAISSGSDAAFFEGNGSDYVIRCIDGTYYRFDYSDNSDSMRRSVFVAVNCSVALMAVLTIAVLLFVRIRLLKPLYRLRDVPFELSKGNLSVGIKESKNHFFGRFTWGLDMLREKLEQQKQSELKLQRDKKTLILSISHDIKTPLSAIKLYSKALSRNLYTDDEKRRQAAESINKNADDIEAFLSQIIKASSEDFLNLTVNKGEFYLAELVVRLMNYYREKTELLKITFSVSDYDNCLLSGDIDRAVEVLQNIIENAIKYGDGEFIKLGIEKDDDCRLITVSNSGSSLSQDELPHIFDSFWRGSNAGSNSGSGLGLYICRQLMLKMDGGIEAQTHDGAMEVTAAFRLA